MAKLSKEDQEALDALNAKLEAPDEPPMGKSVTYMVDLGDKDQVAMAKRQGWLRDEEPEQESTEDEEPEEETPRRKGYFND